MIYTVTFNPAVDYVVFARELKPGAANRADSAQIYFGGKGINVSFVLKELGIDSAALGFTAGFTGAAIEQALADGGIRADFIRLDKGFSRINIKIKTSDETELNGAGPDIPAEKLEELFEKLRELKDGDTVVLAGSIPASVQPDIYEKILGSLADRKIRAVVDATGELLKNVLKYSPFLIKPNDIELGELFGVRIETREQAAEYARELQKTGAKNVLVSMAARGSVLLDENGGVHFGGVCEGKVRNSVGAGDSMVAGFLAGCERKPADYEYALRLGTAAGGATAFSDGLARRDEIERLFKTLT